MYIPNIEDLPLVKWSDRNDVKMSALSDYYQALTKHITLVNEYGKKFGVSGDLLEIHDKSKWGRHEFPFYANRFHGNMIHDAKFIKAMNHHLRTNMHHPEYWISLKGNPVPMPRKHILEMIADWHAASFQYTGSDDIQDWLNRKLDRNKFHPTSLDILRKELQDIGYYLYSEKVS